MPDQEPTLEPPAEAMAGEEAHDQPSSAIAPETEGALAGDDAPEEPSLSPEEGIAAGTWHNNKKVTGLWTINQNRNSWVHIHGVGWKKLATNSDSVTIALTILGAHAKQTDRPANLREDGGRINEIYAW